MLVHLVFGRALEGFEQFDRLGKVTHDQVKHLLGGTLRLVGLVRVGIDRKDRVTGYVFPGEHLGQVKIAVRTHGLGLSHQVLVGFEFGNRIVSAERRDNQVRRTDQSVIIPPGLVVPVVGIVGIVLEFGESLIPVIGVYGQCHVARQKVEVNVVTFLSEVIVVEVGAPGTGLEHQRIDTAYAPGHYIGIVFGCLGYLLLGQKLCWFHFKEFLVASRDPQ